MVRVRTLSLSCVHMYTCVLTHTHTYYLGFHTLLKCIPKSSPRLQRTQYTLRGGFPGKWALFSSFFSTIWQESGGVVPKTSPKRPAAFASFTWPNVSPEWKSSRCLNFPLLLTWAIYDTGQRAKSECTLQPSATAIS